MMGIPGASGSLEQVACSLSDNSASSSGRDHEIILNHVGSNTPEKNMNAAASMRRKALPTIALFILAIVSRGQVWMPLGPDDTNWPSSGSASYQNVKFDTNG